MKPIERRLSKIETKRSSVDCVDWDLSYMTMAQLNELILCILMKECLAGKTIEEAVAGWREWGENVAANFVATDYVWDAATQTLLRKGEDGRGLTPALTDAQFEELFRCLAAAQGQ